MSAHGAFTDRSLRAHGSLTTGSEGKGSDRIMERIGSGTAVSLWTALHDETFTDCPPFSRTARGLLERSAL
jgi:hypothetical protein